MDVKKRKNKRKTPAYVIFFFLTTEFEISFLKQSHVDYSYKTSYYK